MSSALENWFEGLQTLTITSLRILPDIDGKKVLKENYVQAPRGTRNVVPWPEVGGGGLPEGLKFFYFFHYF